MIQVRLYGLLARFARDTRGATAMEYGMIAAIVSIVIIGGLILIREQIFTLPMQEIADAFDTSY